MSFWRHTKALLLAALCLCPTLSWAQEAASNTNGMAFVVENRHFSKYPTPFRKTPGPANQVEVVYFFWYGSPWAAQVDQDLRSWAATRSYPLRFTPSPVAYDPKYGMMCARIFFALVYLKEENRVSPLFLQAVNQKQVDLNNPKSILEWMELHGVSKSKFQNALNNATVRSQAATVPSVMRSYDIKSVPAAVIDGSYLIRAHNNMTPQQWLNTVKFMADKLSQGGPRP